LKGRRAPQRKLGRICTTISAKSPAEMAQKAATAFALGSDLVELRLDLLRNPKPAISQELAHLARRGIFTVRRRDEGGGFRAGERERLALISGIGEIAPLFLDVELKTAVDNPEWFSLLPGESGKIVSWHDFAKTPPLSAMRRARDQARSLGDIAKVVTYARKSDDNLRVLRLYDDEPHNLVAFCMGEVGALSRLVSLRLGSPLAYASLPNEGVAPGQISVTDLVRLKRLWERGEW
jgi:3-dehydroquinate dehydratase I